MSFRAVWVLPLPGSGPEDLIFIKSYPTVEKRAFVFNGPDNHVSLPSSDSVLYDATLEELGLKQSGTKYVESRDTCDKEFQKPVFEVKVPGGKLWPVVIIQKFGLLFCCLPLVEQGCEPRPPLIEIPAVSLGLSLLSAIADFMGHIPKDVSASHPKVLELYSFMCQAAPFGTLLDSNPTTVREAIQNKHSTQLIHVAAHAKQPAWRPVMTKGKAQLSFTITEQVRAVLYNSSNMEDVCSVYGTMSCKADLEGATPEVSMAVIVPQDSPPLDHLIVHPCVQGGDTQIISSGMPGLTSQTTPAKLLRRRLRFIPPREPFTLCHYTSGSAPATPPITASYQMRGSDREVTFTVKVKLNSKVKNALEYCEVQLPFYNRGMITEIDPTPSMGSVVLPNDRRRLGWNLGTRFPARSLEASLQVKVHFAEYDEKRQASTYEDPFCTGLNAYAMIYFKVPDFTFSGCHVDPKTVQIHPNVKPKLNIVREFMSAEYKVWNSHGDAQAVFPVPKYLQH